MVAEVTQIELSKIYLLSKIYESKNGGRGANFRRVKMKMVTTFKINKKQIRFTLTYFSAFPESMANDRCSTTGPTPTPKYLDSFSLYYPHLTYF